MTSKKTRAPMSLKLDLQTLKKLPEKPKSDCSRELPPLIYKQKDAPLFVDENLLVTSLELAHDSHFLLNNNVTHVINCVANNFPSALGNGLTYLDLAMQDSMD